MKKAVSILLTMLLVMGTFATPAVAPYAIAASPADAAAIGNGIVRPTADASTAEAWKSIFSKAEANGRVWTDKSVAADTTDGSFDITLSAMSQEYAMSADERAELFASEAADVLLILDFSGSMAWNFAQSRDTGLTDSRAYAMTQAVNNVVSQIMNANQKNRIMIAEYEYGCDILVPLGRYGHKEADGSYTIPEQYFELVEKSVGWNDYYYFQPKGTVTNMDTGAVLSKTSVGDGGNAEYINGGTASQAGIMYGCDALIKQMQATSYDVQRTPLRPLYDRR